MLFVVSSSCRASGLPSKTSSGKTVRVPSDQGLVTEASLSQLTLDGKRTYSLSQTVESFSGYNLTLRPLLTWKFKYVSIGVEEKKVVWIAGLGLLDSQKTPPVVHLANVKLDSVHEGYLIFRSGTALKLAPKVKIGSTLKPFNLTLDASSHLVTEAQPLP